MHRTGGREAKSQHAGCFHTRREAVIARRAVQDDLAAMRLPQPEWLVEKPPAPTVGEALRAWQASRIDVRPTTAKQHATAENRILPLLGEMPADEIRPQDVDRGHRGHLHPRAH